MEESTIALFCCLHDFARMFSDWERHKLIPSDRQRRRAGILSLAEMLLIMVLLETPLLTRRSRTSGSVGCRTSTAPTSMSCPAMNALWL